MLNEFVIFCLKVLFVAFMALFSASTIIEIYFTKKREYLRDIAKQMAQAASKMLESKKEKEDDK